MKMGTLANIKVNDPKNHMLIKHAGTGIPQNFAPKFLEQRMSKIHDVGGDSSRIN